MIWINIINTIASLPAPASPSSCSFASFNTLTDFAGMCNLACVCMCLWEFYTNRLFWRCFWRALLCEISRATFKGLHKQKQMKCCCTDFTGCARGCNLYWSAIFLRIFDCAFSCFLFLRTQFKIFEFCFRLSVFVSLCSQFIKKIHNQMLMLLKLFHHFDGALMKEFLLT